MIRWTYSKLNYSVCILRHYVQYHQWTDQGLFALCFNCSVSLLSMFYEVGQKHNLCFGYFHPFGQQQLSLLSMTEPVVTTETNVVPNDSKFHNQCICRKDKIQRISLSLFFLSRTCAIVSKQEVYSRGRSSATSTSQKLIEKHKSKKKY